MARIGNVDDGRSVRRLHVRDVERRAVNPDLTAARAVQVRHEAGVGLARHWQLEQVILNPADWFSRTLSAVVPAHSASKTRVNALMLGAHIPEAVVMGPRFRGDDRN